MAVQFKESETMKNLMRAFAGESQARNRYTLAASQAKKNKQAAVASVFLYTAAQEKEHAEIFYNYLKEMAGKNIYIEGSYPIDLSGNLAELLRMAQHNEYEEYDDVYKSFGNKAKEEGFDRIANSFYLVAEIEKTHGDRFGKFAELLEKNELHISDVETGWVCINCGYVYTGKEAPGVCPVCHHDKGFFVRAELSPYQGAL